MGSCPWPLSTLKATRVRKSPAPSSYDFRDQNKSDPDDVTGTEGIVDVNDVVGDVGVGMDDVGG